VRVTRSQDRPYLVEVCRRLLRSDAEPLDVRIQELGDRVEIPGDKRPIATEDRVHALPAAHEAQRTVATSRPSSTRHQALAPSPSPRNVERSPAPIGLSPFRQRATVRSPRTGPPPPAA